MDSMLVDALTQELKKHRVLAVVGTGVSIAATNNQIAASWKGLLNTGIDRCERLVPCPPDWAGRVRAQVEGDMIDLLCAAENVVQRLGAPDGGEYAKWLSDTIGSLKVQQRALLDALVALDIPIVTTNYDGLIEDVTGLRAVTLRDRRRSESLVREASDGVLHLHGFWEEPESVVLGIRSYDDLLKDEFAQNILRTLRTMKTLLFIGFGSGLRDPTFSGLLRWAGRVFRESETRHYRLCIASDLEEARHQHAAEERIAVVSFGVTHEQLVDFLVTLKSNGHA